MADLVKFPKENFREKLKAAATILVKRESDTKKPPSYLYILLIAIGMAFVLYFIFRPPAVNDSYNVSIDQSSHINNVTTIIQPNDKPLRPWAALSKEEKEGIVAEAFILFPEVVSRDVRGKYSNISNWLQKERGIYHKNVRDIFTAGGRGQIIIGDRQYDDIPRVLIILHKNLNAIRALLPTKQKEKEWQEAVSAQLKQEELAAFQAIISTHTQ